MVLKVADRNLPLVETPMGPLVDTQRAGSDTPLGWVLNLAVTGVLDLHDALEHNQPAYAHEIVVRPAGGDRWELSVRFAGEQVITRAELAAVLAELERLRAEAPKPPAPWLFRPDPGWHSPALGEEVVLQALEKRIAAGGIPQAELLRELERHGLLLDGFAPQKIAALEQWHLPILAGYAKAAEEMHRYLRSSERQRHLSQARSQPIIGAPISIDWFRAPNVPEGFEPFDWLGASERVLADAPSKKGPEGEVFTRIGDRWMRIKWRRDDGNTPAIVETALES